METRIVTTEFEGRPEYRLDVLREGCWEEWGTYSHCQHGFVERVADRLQREGVMGRQAGNPFDEPYDAATFDPTQGDTNTLARRIRDRFPDTGSALADRLREDYPTLIGGDPDGGF